jgi:predicted nuclease of predicted toxin-antitoxin system
MPAILLDACVPHGLRKHLTGMDTETAHFAGLDHLSDSALLDAIEGRFDVLVTLDRNLTYQQKIAGRPIAVIVLRVPEQTPEAFRALIPALKEAIAKAVAGQTVHIGPLLSNGGED